MTDAPSTTIRPPPHVDGQDAPPPATTLAAVVKLARTILRARAAHANHRAAVGHAALDVVESLTRAQG